MKRKLVRIAIVLLVLALPLVAWRIYLAHVINKQLAEIRAAGLPTDGKELNHWYPAVPDNENAALVLTQAFVLLRRFPDKRADEVWRLKDKFPKRVDRLSVEQADLIRGYVETNLPALAKMGEALALPASRYPIDLTLLSDTELPHLAHLAEFAYLNQCKSALAIQAGRNEEASSAIEMTLDLARTLDKEPCVISQLVRFMCLKRAVATLEHRINAGPLDSMEITNLFGAFARMEVTNSIARTLAGERAMYASYFNISSKEAERIFPPKKDPEEEAQSKKTFPRHRALALRAIGYYDLELRFFLGTMGTNIMIAGRPYPLCLSVVGYSARASENAKKRNYFTSGIISGLGGAVFSEGDAAAYQRLAMTALTIEQFRNQHGHPPEKLDELGLDAFSKITEDPFMALDLHYRRTGEGYLIYSVGRDQHDDDGLEKSEKKKSSDRKSFDLTFTVER